MHPRLECIFLLTTFFFYCNATNPCTTEIKGLHGNIKVNLLGVDHCIFEVSQEDTKSVTGGGRTFDWILGRKICAEKFNARLPQLSNYHLLKALDDLSKKLHGEVDVSVYDVALGAEVQSIAGDTIQVKWDNGEVTKVIKNRIHGHRVWWDHPVVGRCQFFKTTGKTGTRFWSVNENVDNCELFKSDHKMLLWCHIDPSKPVGAEPVVPVAPGVTPADTGAGTGNKGTEQPVTEEPDEEEEDDEEEDSGKTSVTAEMPMALAIGMAAMTIANII